MKPNVKSALLTSAQAGAIAGVFTTMIAAGMLKRVNAQAIEIGVIIGLVVFGIVFLKLRHQQPKG